MWKRTTGEETEELVEEEEEEFEKEELDELDEEDLYIYIQEMKPDILETCSHGSTLIFPASDERWKTILVSVVTTPMSEGSCIRIGFPVALLVYDFLSFISVRLRLIIGGSPRGALLDL